MGVGIGVGGGGGPLRMRGPVTTICSGGGRVHHNQPAGLEIRMNWTAQVDFFPPLPCFLPSSTSNEDSSSAGGPFSRGSGSRVLLQQMVTPTGGRPDWG